MRNFLIFFNKSSAKQKLFFILFISSFFLTIFINPANSLADVSYSIEELRSQIKERDEEIKKLEKEIAELDDTIKKTAGNTKTLQNDLAKINNTINQLNKEVLITETKISATRLGINKLSKEIVNREVDIEADKNSIGQTIKIINEKDMDSPIETVLSGKNFSGEWEYIDTIEQLQEKIKDRIIGLEFRKEQLTKDKNDMDKQNNDLTKLKNKLVDQKYITSQNKISKDKLLKETQNQEAVYRKMLADRLSRKQDLEKELFEYESQLKVAIDPNSYPKQGTRILNWPIETPYVTQLFGKTADSGRLYASGTHSGVDFRAKIGTPIKASAGGIVMGTGDTDATCPKASYGKWVLLKHPNGLATLYSHLSLIKVKDDENIIDGQVLGYSGDTGYSEGPHLHFGVFVSGAVHVSGPKEYKSRVCGTYMKLPLAPTNAYLDPMSYLPMKGSNIKLD